MKGCNETEESVLHQPAACVRQLTGVGGPQVVRVTGEEGLVVLRRQVHVVVGQRLPTRHPRVPGPQGEPKG